VIAAIWRAIAGGGCATFVAENRKRGLRPTSTYLSYLIEGAREHELPTNYLKKLERVKTPDL
jgi:hypothetical protein